MTHAYAANRPSRPPTNRGDSGIWYGLIATGAACAVLTIRAAAYSVEYFG
jgi:hypothetical protein